MGERRKALFYYPLSGLPGRMGAAGAKADRSPPLRSGGGQRVEERRKVLFSFQPTAKPPRGATSVATGRFKSRLTSLPQASFQGENPLICKEFPHRA